MIAPMRWIVAALLAAAACGSPHSLADARSDAPAPADARVTADADTTPDASACALARCDAHATCTMTAGGATCTCNPGLAGDGHTCVPVAVGLNGLRWEIPCGADASSVACFVTDPQPITANLAGVLGTTYQVTLRFRGVAEQKTYTGGTQDGSFYTGGAEDGGSYNVYAMAVSSPAQTYYLNAGSSNITNCWLLDYTKTIPMDAGATVTLTALAKDGQEIKNRDAATGAPIVVPDIPPAPDPFNGQFIQMDVVSVTGP
jgi:hypothetical protein